LLTAVFRFGATLSKLSSIHSSNISLGSAPFGLFTLTQPDFPSPYPIASTNGKLFA